MKNEVIQEDVEKILRDVMSRLMYAKTEMCKEHPMSDNPPLFLAGKVNEPEEGHEEEDEAANEYQSSIGLEQAYDVAMLPLIHREDVIEAYTDAVKQLPIVPISFVLLGAEGYGRIDENGNPLELTQENYEHGDLQKEFSENPFSSVREVLIVTGVDWNQETLYSGTCAYTYNDRGVPQFGKPMFVKSTMTSEESVENHGRVAKALWGTMTYLKLSMTAQQFSNLLGKAPKNESN